MSKDRDDTFDAARPTLIVQYGDAKRKYRRMDRDVMVLGRAPGCDVGVEAPDVAPVHCVLVRAAEGWRVRDCTGKGATRLNGQSVHDAPLSDEDVLQVGSFSFTLHLPAGHQPLPAENSPTIGQPLQRAQRSRHNLARLALRLRGRVNEMAAAERADRELAERQEALDRRDEELRVLQRDVDARVAEMKLTAQELAAREKVVDADRRLLEKEAAERRDECGAAKRGLAIRAGELTHYAAHLRRLRLRLNEHEESLTARWEEWLREQQEASLGQTQQREKMAREEVLLREQRAEIVRLMGEMRQMRQKPDPQVEALRAENEQLKGGLAERSAALAAMQKDTEELRQRLAAREAGAEAVGSLQRFVVELDTGRRILDEQIRGLQERFTGLEQAAREAETHIGRERVRMAEERQELERLRGDLWPGESLSPGAETIVDVPSPLRAALDGAESPRAPSQATAAAE